MATTNLLQVRNKIINLDHVARAEKNEESVTLYFDNARHDRTAEIRFEGPDATQVWKALLSHAETAVSES